tara:strand:- start:645 stop:929 length:285 start_codon:yes stop_codon:yes gene_type:complete
MLAVGGGFFCFINEKTKLKFYNLYYNLNYYNKKLFNSIFLYPIGYHFTGGLRHLIWDSFPHLLTNSYVTKSSKFLFIASIIPTLILENQIKDKI